jgi:ribonuclease HI
METIITKINEKKDNIIYMLWGKFAQSLIPKIKGNHIIYTETHPSPLSQNRLPKNKRFMATDNHFNKISCVEWKYVHDIPIQEMPVKVKNFPDIQIEYGYNGRDGDPIEIFTDGSCCKNGKKSARGGFSLIMAGNKEHYKNVYYGSVPDGPNQEAPTNIRAEGYAIFYSLKLISKWVKAGKSANVCKIYTDSEFWVNMITKYMPKWKEADFDNKANTDLTKKIWNEWSKINLVEGLYMDIQHVYAHNKNKGAEAEIGTFDKWAYINNESADKVANHARIHLDKKEMLYTRRIK